FTPGMARHRYVVCDVFTDVPLAGNQLAVFTDAREIPEAQLQLLARETKLSETVFVYPPEAGGHVRVRIFTPGAELPFAGHPILGTAFVLGGPLQLVEIRLETQAGTVPVRLEREGARLGYGAMRQPAPATAPFRPGARSPSTSPVTAASPSATRSRSLRAWRSGGRRRCTRSRTRPSTSRSAAPPSSSRAGSSSCEDRSVDPGDGGDVRKLERERAPEHAAVGRDVEPVPRGIE